MAKEIATYSAKITIRSDDEDAEPLKIEEIEDIIEAGIDGEYYPTKVIISATASRDDI